MDAPNGIEDPARSKQSRLGRLRFHFNQEVQESWGDAVLIVGCFITGLLDSAVFNVWSCFVSMQTGNTVYVGLGVSGQPKSQPLRWIKSLTAIAFFILGSFLFSRFLRFLQPLRRLSVVLSFLVQGILCFISAGLVQSKIVTDDAGDQLPDNFIVLLPLALLSMTAAGQCVMSRFLGFGEVTTVVLTSAYCDLVFDPAVFTLPVKGNSKRNRRICAATMVLCGAIAGGFLTEDGDIALALWIAAAIKTLIAIAWVFWPGKGSIRLE